MNLKKKVTDLGSVYCFSKILRGTKRLKTVKIK